MKRRLTALAAAGVALAALTACTPREIAMWQQWHAEDPEAAMAFAEQLPPQPAPQPRTQSSSSGGGTVWDRLAQCESGGNWAINTGNGYSGGLQFLPSTWRAYGGSGMAHQNSREEQIRVAERVLADVGWGAWPACTRKLGLR